MSKLEMELHKKAWGQEISAAANQLALAEARNCAVGLCFTQGEVSVDDVRESLPHLDFGGNWVGSIFRAKDLFEWTGKWVAARHKGSHARPVMVWRLK